MEATLRWQQNEGERMAGNGVQRKEPWGQDTRAGLSFSPHQLCTFAKFLNFPELIFLIHEMKGFKWIALRLPYRSKIQKYFLKK